MAGKLVTHYLQKVRDELPMRDSLPAIPDIPEPYQTDRYEEIAYVEFRDEKSTNSRIRMTSKAGFSRSKRRYQSSGLGDRGLLEIAFTGSNFYLCATTQKPLVRWPVP